MSTLMAKRGLKPIHELAANRPHGNRLKYLAGCRCMLCRAANSRYETERQAARKAGDWNGLVSAKRAQRHLVKLARRGVGRRAVRAACDVAESVLIAIRSGRKTHIRKRTETKILSVNADAISDGALVPAASTWMLINRLLDQGFTKRELARRLGYKSPALQINKRMVKASTAVKVERFYRRMME